MSEITFKNYEKRPEPDPEVEVCECGHEEMRHHNSMQNSILRLDSRYFHKDSSKKIVESPKIDSCETCMCKHFKKITTMKKSKYTKQAGWFN